MTTLPHETDRTAWSWIGKWNEQASLRLRRQGSGSERRQQRHADSALDEPLERLEISAFESRHPRAPRGVGGCAAISTMRPLPAERRCLGAESVAVGQQPEIVDGQIVDNETRATGESVARTDVSIERFPEQRSPDDAG